MLKPLLKVVESTKVATIATGKVASEKNNDLTGNAVKKTGSNEPDGAFIMEEKDQKLKEKKTALQTGETMHMKGKEDKRKVGATGDQLPRSAYDNVIIEAKIESLIPQLVELDKIDLLDALIDVFGEKHSNHLSLLLAYGLEEQAM
jgi:hypothetical protein